MAAGRQDEVLLIVLLLYGDYALLMGCLEHFVGLPICQLLVLLLVIAQYDDLHGLLLVNQHDDFYVVLAGAILLTV